MQSKHIDNEPDIQTIGLQNISLGPIGIRQSCHCLDFVWIGGRIIPLGVGTEGEGGHRDCLWVYK